MFRKKGPRRAASTRKETPASDAHHCLGHTDMASETEVLLTSPGRAVARHRAMVAIVVAVLCATAFALVASAGGESAARAFARLGVSGARVRSSHVDGRTPTVFVAETEDPSREDWFEPLKATILATADLPELIGRLEPVESVRATDLPTRIELYEEATQNLKDGFASLVGEYVGRRHAYADADVHPLFTLDEGKKMIVRRDVVDAHPRLGAFLADVRKADASASLGADGSDAGSKPATESSVGAEISESEKAVLGAKIGASVAHLLAWTRATSRVDSSAWVLGSTTRLLGPPSASPGAFVPREHFVSMLDAVSAYRPSDADVVFLDIVGRASDEKKDADAATVRLTKPDAWSSDVGFVPVDDGNGDVHAGFYLITRRFMERAPKMIDEGGFGFVDEWLAEKCERGKLRCYRTTPAFGDWEASRTASGAAETE